jgi:ABC-2 type transport system permease protein
MNPPSNNDHEFPLDSREFARTAMAETQPMYWSVRRELWENRSIVLAPLIVAAVVLFATLMGTISLPRKMSTLPMLDPARQHAVVARPFQMAPAPIMLASFIVGMFFSLDALYGERRDRSILFWKSMPVSDRTTVLSKFLIPVAVLPVIALVLSAIVQVLLLFASTAVLAGNGMNPGRLWTEFRFFQGVPIMIYGLTVHALWFAPIYAWLLLLSAWARRTPFLWAVLLPFALFAFERIALRSRPFSSFVRYRIAGAMKEAFALEGTGGNIDRYTQLSPGRFLTSPGLWIGLLFAAAFLAVAVRLRRNREPI